MVRKVGRGWGMVVDRCSVVQGDLCVSKIIGGVKV